MEELIKLDHLLFSKINLEWTNAIFDWLLPRITDLHRNPWSLIALLPLLSFWIYKQRTVALRWIFIAIISVSLSDLFCYRVVKSVTKRDRPEFTGIELNLRTQRHAGSSFPSNHAANMFAAATTLSFALPNLKLVFFFVALLIAYSRIYVGVHFPFDVITGAFIGTVIALIVVNLTKRLRVTSKQKSLSET